MDVKRCFFIGHRDAPLSITCELEYVIDNLIEKYGVTEFLVGKYGNFDRIVSTALIKAKQRYPQITLLCLIPYHPTEKKIKMPEGFDATFYPPGMEHVPQRFAIVRANRYALEHADYLIAYAWHPASNALELLKHAQAREKKGLISIFLLSR